MRTMHLKSSLEKLKSIHSLLWIMLTCITITGCGYHLEKRSMLFPGVSQVCVPIFENNTIYTYAGTIFSNALIQEILEKTNSRINSAETNSYRINGIINKIEFSPIVRDSNETILQQKVTVWADINLINIKGNSLWRAKGITANENYTLPLSNLKTNNLKKQTENIQAEEDQIKRSIQSIARKLAEKTVKAMKNNF